MKMTLEEFLMCPRGMRFEEYEKILARIRRLSTQLHKLSEERDFLEDSLAVLSDEVGSIRWQQKDNRLNEVNLKIDKLSRQLDDLEVKINR